MPATSGYNPGVESNDVELSMIAEATWKTAPASQFQVMRYTGESLGSSKQRSRPNEITAVRQVARGVTQQESADGAINFALSYGTFDIPFSGILGNDWSAALSIDSITTDISFAATGNKMTSTLAGKFTAVIEGQFIRVFGAVASSGANNGVYRVAIKNSAIDLTLAGKTVINETSAAGNIKIRSGGYIRNGNLIKTHFIQKKLRSNLWLRYPGSFISQFQVSGGVGNFFQGSFNVLASSEEKGTTDAGTGGVLAAPTGGFHDAVAGFGGVFWNDTLVNATVDNVSVTGNREGASMVYGMGSAQAQAVLAGQFAANGSMRLFFNDFTYWDAFKGESLGRLSFRTDDADGAEIVFTFQSAMLLNPRIVAGGRDQQVMAEFTIEGNPANTAALATFQIDKLPATAV